MDIPSWLYDCAPDSCLNSKELTKLLGVTHSMLSGKRYPTPVAAFSKRVSNGKFLKMWKVSDVIKFMKGR